MDIKAQPRFGYVRLLCYIRKPVMWVFYNFIHTFTFYMTYSLGLETQLSGGARPWHCKGLVLISRTEKTKRERSRDSDHTRVIFQLFGFFFLFYSHGQETSTLGHVPPINQCLPRTNHLLYKQIIFIFPIAMLISSQKCVTLILLSKCSAPNPRSPVFSPRCACMRPGPCWEPI